MSDRLRTGGRKGIAGSQRLAVSATISGRAPRAVGSRLLANATMLLVGIVVLAIGCGRGQTSGSSDGRLPVFAGIPPLAYLVEQIGGERVKVDVLVQPGQDPHTFQRSPHQALALGRAGIFFKIDMPFENVVLEKAQEGNRRLVVVDATRGIEKRSLDAACCEKSGHDHEASHPDAVDPHVWLSPPLLKTMAANIAAGLCKADPAHRKEYERNLASLLERLDALHARTKTLLAPYRGRAFYVFHPGFAYFADAYGLKETPVQVGGQDPSPKQIRRLIEQARKDRVKTVFVQPEFDPKSVQAVADAIGGQVVTINGLGKDVISDIEDIARKVAKAMKDGGEGRGTRGEGRGMRDREIARYRGAKRGIRGTKDGVRCAGQDGVDDLVPHPSPLAPHPSQLL
jgi:zinc transport system substrate-binding protein